MKYYMIVNDHNNENKYYKEFETKKDLLEYIHEYYIKDVIPACKPVFVSDFISLESHPIGHRLVKILIIKGEVAIPEPITITEEYAIKD